MTNSNDILKIDTPENVTFDYDVAGIGSRFLAALADTAIILVLQLVVLGTVILLFSLANAAIPFMDAGPWLLAAFGMISFLLIWGYYIGFELFWNGQTPGKRWIGLRVIRLDGTPITASESIIRNLVRLIDLLPFAYGVGVVTMFINPNSRRVGDLAAGTVVVYDRRTTDLKGNSAPLDTGTLQGEIPPGFPVEKMTHHDLEVVEEFMMRRTELSNRHALARHLLASIAARLGIPVESVDMNKPEHILAAIYKATRANKSE
jgi:uncharacterized RDD family membrane protein YckC